MVQIAKCFYIVVWLRILCLSSTILEINPCIGCQSLVPKQKWFTLEMEKCLYFVHHSYYHNNTESMFEIHAMVCETYDNIDLVLWVKNFVKLEGKIHMKELNINSPHRTVHVFPVLKEVIKPKERRYVKIEGPFLGKISELGIIKLLGLNTNMPWLWK